MDTSGPRRELDAFMSEVTPLVAGGDEAAFGRCAEPMERLIRSGFVPPFVPARRGGAGLGRGGEPMERLIRSGFVPAFVAAELERAADAPEYELGDGAGISLARAPSFSLRLSLLEPTGEAPGERIDGLAGHLAVGV